MPNAYAIVERVVADIRAGIETDVPARVLGALALDGITPRRDDGDLRQVTISQSLTDPAALVVGLRYDKLDGTQSEDLFVLRPGQAVASNYKGALQRVFPEYAGTHKQTVDYAALQRFSGSDAMVNTATYPYKK